MSRRPDIAVIGAGLVGSALALGLTRTAARATLKDALHTDYPEFEPTRVELAA